MNTEVSVTLETQDPFCRNLGINELKCLSQFLSGAFPIWMRRIHIVNNPRIFNMFLTLCKPFTSERVRENIVMHR